MKPINVFNSRHLPLMLALLIGAVILLLNLTKSALWYDEAVEYYFSKILYGTVPCGETMYAAGSNTTNMYQRICVTFQPPLFNIIMYLWLLVADSVWWFRLLGIIFTLTGSIAVYKTLRMLSNNIYSAFCALFYLLLPCISYYALECGEYYMMLAFLTWSIYYFVKVMLSPSACDLTMFLILACLSVYSQYGASIQILVLYAVIWIVLIRLRQKRLIVKLSWMTILIALFAVLPLLYFFLLGQMEGMRVSEVSHKPYFAFGFFAIDMVVSFVKTISFFCMHHRFCTFAFILAIIISSVMSLFKGNKITRTLFITAFITWITYYIATATNFYGVKVWDPSSLGTNNVGDRYVLFAAPLFFMLVCSGMYDFYKFLIDKFGKSRILAINGACGLLAAVILVLDISVLNAKDRHLYLNDIVDVWFEETDKSVPTFVDNWLKFQMTYYITHDQGYQADYNDSLCYIQSATTDSLAIEKAADEIKMFDNDRFYLILSDEYNDIHAFNRVLKYHGYRCDTLYGKTAFLYYCESINE